jgi:hypothetical protein
MNPCILRSINSFTKLRYSLSSFWRIHASVYTAITVYVSLIFIILVNRSFELMTIFF